jgi:hypothetical protein
MLDDCDGNAETNTVGAEGAAGDGGGATIQLISMCISCYWGSRTMISIGWLEVVAGNLLFIFKFEWCETLNLFLVACIFLCLC